MGRFLGGALGLTGSAVAGTAAATALANPVSLTILATIAAFAGGAAIYRGIRNTEHDDESSEILKLMQRQMQQDLDLAKALAKLPGDLPASHAEVCKRVRQVASILAGDPNAIVDRLMACPELQTFLHNSTQAIESEFDRYQADLDCLIKMAFDNKNLSEDVVTALNAFDAKIDHVTQITERTERKIDAIVDQLMARVESQAMEIGSLREQLRRAIEGKVEEERAAGRSVDVMLDELRHGDPNELLEFLDRQVEDEETVLVEHHRERAAVAYVVGDIDRALNSLNKILQLLPDDLDAINRLGHIHRLRGDLPRAEATFRHLLELADDEAWQAAAWSGLGNVMFTRRDLDGAEAMYRRALEIDENLDSLEGMAVDLNNLAIVMLDRRDLDEAEAICRKALAINEKLGRLDGVANAFGNLGIIMEIRGNSQDAEAMYRMSLGINKKRGRLEGLANDYGNLGNIMFARDDLGAAEDMYRKSLAIEIKLSRLEGMANAYGNLAIIMQARDDLDEAESMCRKSVKINEKLGRFENMANQYGILGFLATERGGNGWVATVREHWTKARDLFAELGDEHNVAKYRGLLDDVAKLPDE